MVEVIILILFKVVELVALMVLETRGSNCGHGLGRGRGRTSFLHCTHCGGDSHIVDHCYVLYSKPWEIPNTTLFTADDPSVPHKKISAPTPPAIAYSRESYHSFP